MSKPSRSEAATASASAAEASSYGRLDLEQARLALRAAGREVRGVHVAVAGHRGHVGQSADQRRGRRRRSSTTARLEEQARRATGAACRGTAPRRRRTSRGPAGAGQARSSVDRAATEQEPGAAEVGGLEVADGADGGVDRRSTATASAAEPSAAATAVS